MKQHSLFYILITLLLGVVWSCNTDTNAKYTIDMDTSVFNTEVTAFSLDKNDSILADLDSVFFAVDLDRGLIFNPDSLPKGTKLGKVKVKLSFATEIGWAKLLSPTTEGYDSIEYNNNEIDSINFANGSVKMLVMPLIRDEKYVRTYTIQIAVHKMDPDSLYWSQLAKTTLPTSLSAPVAQKSVEHNGALLCLTADADGNACMATAEDAYQNTWTYSDVTLPANADVATLASSSEALYILADNQLWLSTDLGASWSATGVEMTTLIGGYADKAMGVLQSGSDLYHVSYPAVMPVLAASDFPLRGMSVPVSYTTEWSEDPMMVIVGGETLNADGTTSLSGDTWAYDGNMWAKLASGNIEPAAGMAFLKYYTFSTNTQWITTKYPALFAFGGRNAEGKPNKVYVSRDRGMHWRMGDENLQLPDYLKVGYGAQAYTQDHTQKSRAAFDSDDWTICAPRRLAPWWQIEDADSRISQAITSWECPYIYLFGGYDTQDELSNTVWRGLINRLSFRPLY